MNIGGLSRQEKLATPLRVTWQRFDRVRRSSFVPQVFATTAVVVCPEVEIIWTRIASISSPLLPDTWHRDTNAPIENIFVPARG